MLAAMPETSLAPRGAVLDPAAASTAFVITRHAPDPGLAPFVRHYWLIRWDLEGKPPHTQTVLPVPASNAVLEGELDSVGVAGRDRFDRVLEGQGAVVGTTFRSTGLFAFLRAPVHPLADRSVPWREVFRGDVAPLKREVRTHDDAAIVRALDRFFLAEAPTADPESEEIERWVALAESEPGISRADVLAARVGVGVRTMERRMRERVGLSPKQLLRRWRLLEAAARLERGGEIDHAGLAHALGYADQSHFVRDFARVTGRSPARYAKTQPPRPPR
jgi:AraC-like DNA-binding protein